MSKTDTVAAATVTPGLVLRPYAGGADHAEMARIKNAEWEADGLTYRETPEELAAWYGHPSEQFDPARDLVVAEIDGRMVGHAQRDWVDTSDGFREYRCGGAVDPAWRRRGIGRVLLRENERASRALAAGHETDRPRVVGCFCDDRNLGAAALARSEGFEPVRWFFDMQRPGLQEAVPEPPALPAGLEVRPVTADQLRTIWNADVEAFRDHWGGFDASEEAFNRYQDAPDFDPTMWVIAWDGGEVAAGVINTIYPHENAASGLLRGWLDSVFTRRRWRKRGVASALIGRSLHVLAERGMEVAALGVDADNPNGAMHLYEKFGFAVAERATAWRKPMETQELAE